MSGIEKEIDSLGRIVIPAKFRSKLNMPINSKVIITLDNGFITIAPKLSRCALCGSTENINRALRLCTNCIKRIRSEEVE